METIGIGVIGCGGMGRSLANGANAVEGIEVICVSDLQEELAKTLAGNLNTNYTTDYHELLANDDIQAFLIASPRSCTHRWQLMLRMQVSTSSPKNRWRRHWQIVMQ